jgi:hypothetical protein
MSMSLSVAMIATPCAEPIRLPREPIYRSVA